MAVDPRSVKAHHNQENDDIPFPELANWTQIQLRPKTLVEFDPSISTSVIPEGTSLYYTNERVDDRVAALMVAAGLLEESYDDPGGTLTLTAAMKGAKAAKTGNQSLADNVLETLTFGTEDFDEAAYHDNSMNPSRLTVPATGKYLVGITLALDAWGAGEGRLAIELHRNGSLHEELADELVNSGGTPSRTVQTLVSLTAADYLEAKVLQNSGGARNATTSTKFWIVRVA